MERYPIGYNIIKLHMILDGMRILAGFVLEVWSYQAKLGRVSSMSISNLVRYRLWVAWTPGLSLFKIMYTTDVGGHL